MYDVTRSVLGRVENTIKKHNMLKYGDGVVVGLSGGADSVAMLVLLCMLKDKYNLNIIGVHINHSIRGDEADRDEEFSKELCNKLAVEFVSFKEDVPRYAKENRISEELAGREIRYAKFNEVLKEYKANKIAVAHHKNDSVETVLIKLTRGCSLNGLKGILPTNGNIIRPLIDLSRDEIEQFLSAEGYAYVTDSTNLKTDYTRNIIRNIVIPELEKINSGFINTVYSNTSAIREDDDYLDKEVKKYNDIVVMTPKGDISIIKPEFSALHNSIKRRLLIKAVALLTGTRLDIEKKHIDIILQNENNNGAELNFVNDITAHISARHIILTKGNAKKDICKEYVWDINSTNSTTIDFCGNSIILELTDYNNFMTQKNRENVLFINGDCCSSGFVTIRNRREGDRFKPSGMTGTKKLKQYLCELKIPALYRDDIPLAVIEGKIAGVIPYRTGEDFKINKDTNKILKISTGGKYE